MAVLLRHFSHKTHTHTCMCVCVCVCMRCCGTFHTKHDAHVCTYTYTCKHIQIYLTTFDMPSRPLAEPGRLRSCGACILAWWCASSSSSSSSSSSIDTETPIRVCSAYIGGRSCGYARYVYIFCMYYVAGIIIHRHGENRRVPAITKWPWNCEYPEWLSMCAWSVLLSRCFGSCGMYYCDYVMEEQSLKNLCVKEAWVIIDCMTQLHPISAWGADGIIVHHFIKNMHLLLCMQARYSSLGFKNRIYMYHKQGPTGTDKPQKQDSSEVRCGAGMVHHALVFSMLHTSYSMEKEESLLPSPELWSSNAQKSDSTELWAISCFLWVISWWHCKDRPSYPRRKAIFPTFFNFFPAFYPGINNNCANPFCTGVWQLHVAHDRLLTMR